MVKRFFMTLQSIECVLLMQVNARGDDCGDPL